MRPLPRMRCKVGSIDGRIDGIGTQSLEPEKNRAVGAVSAAGQGERPVELRRDLRAVSSRPRAANSSTKRRAAFIGPMVCELEGPMPILKMSKTLRLMQRPWLPTDRESYAACIRRCRAHGVKCRAAVVSLQMLESGQLRSSLIDRLEFSMIRHHYCLPLRS